MYCRRCGYDLKGLGSRCCPECGSAFDPDRPTTTSRWRVSWLLRRWAWRFAALAGCLSLAAAVGAAALTWKWKADHDAGKALEELGGRITYARHGATWLARLLGDRFGYLLDRADVVELYELPVTDDTLLQVGHLHDLRALALSKAKITDAGLIHIKDLSGLRDLDLTDCAIDDDGVKSLRGLRQLTVITLDGTKITNAGLEPLRDIKGLFILSVVRTQVGDDGLAFLEGLPELADVNISETRVTDKGMRHLTAIPKLDGVSMMDTAISDQGLAELAGCPRLTQIGAGRTHVTEAGAAALKRRLPEVKVWHAAGEYW